MYIQKLLFIIGFICFSTLSYASPQNGFGAYGGIITASEGESISKGLSMGTDARIGLSFYLVAATVL